MKVAIHQPEYLVWLGFIDKIKASDIFVILDSVQFKKNNFQNRNKIRTKEGWQWLTVPLQKHPLATTIHNIAITQNDDWKRKHIEYLRLSYKNAPYFDTYIADVTLIIQEAKESLVDLNVRFIEYMLNAFDIQKKIVFSSQLSLSASLTSSNLLAAICKDIGADVYLSGPSGKDYLDLKIFESNNIEVIFHTFKHPEYKQQYEPFIPGMSAIDVLFNYGKDAKNILC